MSQRTSQREYGNRQRSLLQYFISWKVVQENEIVSHFGDDYSDDIAQVNERIQTMMLEIKQTLSEEDGKRYWGLVNISNDEFSQMANSYQKNEIELFKLIMDQIVEESEIDYLSALNLRSEGTNLSRDSADATIRKFIQDKWLRMEGASLLFGVRTSLELQPYLESKYGDKLFECVVCTDIVFSGESCKNKHKMHKHCSKRWFKEKADKICPTCKIAWVQEESEEEDESD